MAVTQDGLIVADSGAFSKATKVRITIGAFIGVVGFVVGCALWASNTTNQIEKVSEAGERSAVAVEKMSIAMENRTELLWDIKVRQQRVEGDVDKMRTEFQETTAELKDAIKERQP